MSLSLQSVKLFVQYYKEQKARERKVLFRRYNPIIGIILTVVWPNATEQYERIERHVLQRKIDADALLTFKQGVTDECNMTAVAVSGS